LCPLSSAEDNLLRPFKRRAAKVLLPFEVAMRVLKPWRLVRFLFDGWYVLFVMTLFYLGLAKIDNTLEKTNY
jgi:hypothetical protein